MYLSRLILNPRSHKVRRDLARFYELHRTLLRAFPNGQEGGPGRVLFRVDEDRATGVPTILVQSERAPDWSRFDVGTDYLLDVGEPNPACKEWNPSFICGQQLFFRLRANPSVKRDGKRLGLLTEEQQTAWLRRKGEAGGFVPLQVRVIPEGLQKSRRQEDSTVTLLAVRFDGILRVTDPDAFLETVRAGIGSAKAFGFGMLSLARG